MLISQLAKSHGLSTGKGTGGATLRDLGWEKAGNVLGAKQKSLPWAVTIKIKKIPIDTAIPFLKNSSKENTSINTQACMFKDFPSSTDNLNNHQ